MSVSLCSGGFGDCSGQEALRQGADHRPNRELHQTSTDLNARTHSSFRKGNVERAGRIAQVPAESAQNWDLRWIDDLKGPHKQVFDLADAEPRPSLLHSAFRGITWTGSATCTRSSVPRSGRSWACRVTPFPSMLSDRLWEKYALGRALEDHGPGHGEAGRAQCLPERRVRPCIEIGARMVEFSIGSVISALAQRPLDLNNPRTLREQSETDIP